METQLPIDHNNTPTPAASAADTSAAKETPIWICNKGYSICGNVDNT